MIDRCIAGRVIEVKRLIENISREYRQDVCPKAREFTPLPSPEKVSSHAALDGGNQLLQLEDTLFYVVKGWAHVYERGRGQGVGDLGVIVPPHHPDYRVTIYRDILEVSSLIGSGVESGENLAGEAEVILFDGNIRNFIRWWSPGSVSLEEAARLDIQGGLDSASERLWELYKRGPSVDSMSDLNCDGVASCLEEFIVESPVRPRSSRLIMELAGEDVDRKYFAESDWITALEVAEKLYLYKAALESVWRNKGYAVFLSKSSTTTMMCRGKRSDLYYVKLMHDGKLKPGYVFWEGGVQCGAYEITRFTGRRPALGGRGVCDSRVKPSMKHYRFYPRHLGLYEFYAERLGAIEFYVRLTGTGPFMNANLVFDMGEGPSTYGEAREMLEAALAKLASLPMNYGYPVALYIAHHHARILPEEVVGLARAVGLELQVDPRMKVTSHSRW